MILAAIDIGSNAARLLIQKVNLGADGQPQFSKINLLRIPLRLGFDVFIDATISKAKAIDVINTMKLYRLAMEIHKVERYRACATSAMRDAKNAKELIERIYRETGIVLEIISGSEEAQILYDNHLNAHIDVNKSYLYIDVGGGSTEITFMCKGEIVDKQSFDMGTIRLLKKGAKKSVWNAMQQFVLKYASSLNDLCAIGSGGNINKVFSISKIKENEPLSLSFLKSIYAELDSLSIEERKAKYKLKEDRADVIVPALEIYIKIMTWASVAHILVPKIGLADGIIKQLYEEEHLHSI
jgi:exopolyphosphatase/guanosine-5'-triphosphate,3'-diphosphate pyrophosphatase